MDGLSASAFGRLDNIVLVQVAFPAEGGADIDCLISRFNVK